MTQTPQHTIIQVRKRPQLTRELLRHIDSFVRRSEADFSPIHDCRVRLVKTLTHVCGSIALEKATLQKTLCHRHPVRVVVVGHVGLDRRKLVVVLVIQPLIPEHFPHLINTIEAPHDQLFQREFRTDSKRQILVLRVAASDERCSHCAACHAAQNRGFHVKKPLFFHKRPNETQNLDVRGSMRSLCSAYRTLDAFRDSPSDPDIATLHRAIANYLSILHVWILDLVPLARKGPQTRREKGDLFRKNTQLSHICSSRYSADPNHISCSQILMNLSENCLLLSVIYPHQEHLFRVRSGRLIRIQRGHHLKHGFTRTDIIKIQF